MTQDYTATTDSIRVSVRSFFLADQSDPDENRFVWAYRVRIENLGRLAVQLLRRTWRITDGMGRTQTISGEGVVGQTPTLDPGETFEYTSATPLETPSGIMRGTYHMIQVDTLTPLDVELPAFSLDSPHQDTSLH
jgi:ApaG protein